MAYHLLLSLFAFLPAGPTPSGPPAPHLARDPDRQVRLDQSARAHAFRAAFPGWVVRWDADEETPRAVMGPALHAADVPALVDAVARLAGLDPSALVPSATTVHGRRSGQRWLHVAEGAVVEGDAVDVFSEDGRSSFALVSLHHPRLRGPRSGEVAFRPPGGDWLWATRALEGDDVVYRDRAGAEAYRWSQRSWLDVLANERTVGDPLVRGPAPYVTVSDGVAVALTDATGAHVLPAPYAAMLEGTYVTVEADGLLEVVDPVVGDTLTGYVDVTGSTATTFHHFNVVRDWLMLRDPTNPWPPLHVPAQVDLTTGDCNAYYTNGTINFYQGDGACVPFGEIADVVYHEYGHGIHHFGLLGGVFAGDVSEGSSDFVGCTLVGDPRVGLGYEGPNTFIRQLGTDKVYPDDATGEVHNDGLIWGSFLWNLREQWIAAYGFVAGIEATEELFLRTLTYGPSLTDLYEAVLQADDDDGDVRNGTPHDCELTALLDLHGLGPGPMGWVVLDHAPVADQPSNVSGGPASVAESAGPTGTFDVALVTPECGGFDPDSVRVHYALDPDPSLPVAELVTTELVPVRTGTQYDVTFPDVPAGTEVAYFAEWSTLDGAIVERSHGGTQDGLWRYVVGDRETPWCEDFETGAPLWTLRPGLLAGPGDPAWVSDWEVAAPLGLGFDPAAAWAGVAILGTNLTGEDDGEYAEENAEVAQSPEVVFPAAGARSLFRLAFRRYLSVEHSPEDRAEIWATWAGGTQELWANPVGADGDVIDREWVVHTDDLRALLERTDRAAFAFTLATDKGTEYGGWNVDDVCVEVLARPEEHYRASGLVATPEADGIGLAWTQAYVSPLYATVVVRSTDGLPDDLSDGVIVDLDLQPVPGEGRTVLDEGVDRSGTVHYAVFSAESEDGWFLDAVLGENAAVVEAEPPTGTTSAPTVEVTGEPAAEAPERDGRAEAPAGCGCGNARGGALLPLLLVVSRVRRRR